MIYFHRCVSIGEVALDICERKAESDDSPMKKQRVDKSHYFHCGVFDPLEAFALQSLGGESQCELYVSLAKELIQQIFYNNPFTSQSQHQALSLHDGDGDGDDINPIQSLSKLYSLASPLLEFMWLAIKYAGSSNVVDDSTVKSKGVVKILSLDCVSRDEPYIVCALYAIKDDHSKNNHTSINGYDNKYNNGNGISKSTVDSSPDDMLRLVGFIDVQLFKINESIVPISPHNRDRGNSNLTDDTDTIKNNEKTVLKIKSLSHTFKEQSIDMEVYRECLQRKMWILSHPNSFHNLIEKLISLYCD